MAKTKVSCEIIVVDYTKSLKEMIADCGFDGYVDPDITKKNFPIKKGLKRVRMEEVHFNKSMTNEKIDAEFKKRGLRDATLPEGLAWAKHHPDNQRKYPIVIRGSVWQRWDGDRGVACLWGGTDGRDLDLDWFDDDWDEDYRFAAVRES